MPEHHPDKENAATEILFTGKGADLVWERISPFPELLHGWEDVDPRRVTPDDCARFLTLCQIVSFGESKRYDSQYGSRLERNRYLAHINPRIIGLADTLYSQTLVLDGSCGLKEIDLGFFDGAVVVYPLNRKGTAIYKANLLPPHQFVSDHLISGDSGIFASSSFIGAAIHIPSIRDLMTAVEFGSRDGFKEFNEPEGVCRAIGERIVEFSPDVDFTVCNIRGRSLPSLRPSTGDLLPTVFSAISGRGHGETTLLRLGFIRDRHAIDRDSLDRRYVFDLNELTRTDLPDARRLHLLNSWRWFLKHWKKSVPLAANIEAGISAFIENLDKQ